jgi:hypothetical protein
MHTRGGPNPLLDALGQTLGHLSDNWAQLSGRAAGGLGASTSAFGAGAGAGATIAGTMGARGGQYSSQQQHHQQQQQQHRDHCRPPSRMVSPGCWVPPVAVSFFGFLREVGTPERRLFPLERPHKN